jgi:hypothetical protein
VKGLVGNRTGLHVSENRQIFHMNGRETTTPIIQTAALTLHLLSCSAKYSNKFLCSILKAASRRLTAKRTVKEVTLPSVQETWIYLECWQFIQTRVYQQIFKDFIHSHRLKVLSCTFTNVNINYWGSNRRNYAILNDVSATTIVTLHSYSVEIRIRKRCCSGVVCGV